MARWRRHMHKADALQRRLLLAAIALAALMVSGAAPALAHVDVDVGDGQYVMEIGFRDEPAFLGQPNAVYLHVAKYGTGGTEPVEGLASTLSVEVEKDGQTLNPPLVPMGEGVYEAVFVPTVTGDYTFHITGKIGDATVDETVTSGPNTFNSVEPLSVIEFPVKSPDPTQFQSVVQEAQSAAATARMFAFAGIAIGLLGLIVGAVALVRSGSKSGPAPATAAAPAAPSAEPSGKLIR